MSITQTLTTVHATGVALAKFDSVKFSITVEAKAKTGPQAKEKARPAIDAAAAELERLEASGVEIDRAGLKATNSTSAVSRYDQASGSQKPDGYRTVYTLSFRCPNVDRASEIQDALSSIEGVQCGAPDFKIKDLAALHKAALRDAKAKADERFANECEILGLHRADYALSTYDVSYDDRESAGAQPMRAMMALESHDAGGGAPKPIEIHAGQARVKATLSVTYAAKQQRATRNRSTAKGDNGGVGRRPAAATATG